MRSRRNPYRAVIDNVVHIVEKELKQILKRDINKRICETYAFLQYVRQLVFRAGGEAQG